MNDPYSVLGVEGRQESSFGVEARGYHGKRRFQSGSGRTEVGGGEARER